MSLGAVYLGAGLAILLSATAIGLKRYHEIALVLGSLSLISVWLATILYAVPVEGYKALLLYTILLGPTLAAILGDPATTSLAGAIAAGALIAQIGLGHSLALFILGLEASVAASYAAIALGESSKGYEAALEFFVASSVAVVFIALGLFGGNNPYSYLLVVIGALLELAIAPFHLWGVDVVYKASLPSILAAFTAPKIPVAYVLVSAVHGNGHSYSAIYASLYIVAILAAIWASLVGASYPRHPRKSLAYGSIAHLSLLLFLVPLAGLGPSILSYYLACYVLGEAGLIALIYSAEAAPGSQRRGLGVDLVFAALLIGLVGIPPAGSFLAKILVLLASSHSMLRMIAALGALLVSSPLLFYFYYETLLMIRSAGYPSRQALFVSTVASIMLIALFPFAPMG
ncbi:hypothetical protein PYJP_17270 [Pyrofollis japonicus]|uniref:proton-conducting transporter transmembrane domain-containing protein n=1 Tax=Pyrofollis japonicus TaxID=3060460 RepID=UPI00295B76DE|nr:proton-conducting transporter membrane subunit [Pyrofollis japonicus]BEP18375.1 hypothetical protein PYJP_17270 [Pyrofollis japonicus]